MKRYFLVALLAVILSIGVSACSGGRSMEISENPTRAPVVTEESAQVADVTGVQDERGTSVSKEAEVNVDPSAGFVKPSNEEIQTALKNAGFYTGSIDGKIGALSKKAIMDFQQQNGLAPDGKVGRRTWSILKKFLSPEAHAD